MQTARAMIVLIVSVFLVWLSVDSAETAWAQEPPAHPNVDEVVARCQEAHLESLTMTFDERMRHILGECAHQYVEPECRDAMLEIAALSEVPHLGTVYFVDACLDTYCPLLDPQPAICAFYDFQSLSDPAMTEAIRELFERITARDLGPTLSSTAPRNPGAAVATLRCTESLVSTLELGFDHVEEHITLNDVYVHHYAPVAACADMVVEPECHEVWSSIEGLADVQAIHTLAEPCGQAYCELLPGPQPDLCNSDLGAQDESELRTLWREFQRAVLAFDNGVALLGQIDVFTADTLYELPPHLGRDTDHTVPATGPELFMPYSSAEDILYDWPLVTITADAILVEGKLVLSLVDGRVRDSDWVTEFSPIIPDLQSVLESALDARYEAGAEFGPVPLFEEDERVTVVADHETRYKTLFDVIMTSAAAGLPLSRLAVLGVDRSSLWELPEFPPGLPVRSLSVQLPERDSGEGGPVPNILVTITDRGFTLSDLTESPAFTESHLWAPVVGCREPEDPGLIPVTVCIPPSRADEPRLIDRLDYRSLYNRLVEIHNYHPWAPLWDEETATINLAAEYDTPIEVIVRVMDVARYFLQQDRYSDDEAFQNATYRDEGGSVPLFGRVVFDMPRWE